jgi:hypothetical protein
MEQVLKISKICAAGLIIPDKFKDKIHPPFLSMLF